VQISVDGPGCRAQLQLGAKYRPNFVVKYLLWTLDERSNKLKAHDVGVLDLQQYILFKVKTGGRIMMIIH
jgi:hypothetical protein